LIDTYETFSWPPPHFAFLRRFEQLLHFRQIDVVSAPSVAESPPPVFSLIKY